MGLDADAARQALESSQYVDAVRADQAQAAAYGINGVPFFVIDGKYGVSGAQPPEAFAQVARQVWAERREARGGAGDRLAPQPGRFASMSPTIAGSSGFICGRKRWISPLGSTRNFSKFHATRPALPSASGAFFSSL